MRIIKIGLDDLALLEEFVASLGDSATTFRYFQKRPLSVIGAHVATFLGLDDDGKPVCYGHLDREGETIWLGICVSESWRGRGLGWMMMERLLSSARAENLRRIRLSVDKVNAAAIRLYEAFGFKLERDSGTCLYYALHLDD